MILLSPNATLQAPQTSHELQNHYNIHTIPYKQVPPGCNTPHFDTVQIHTFLTLHQVALPLQQQKRRELDW